ncbi:MAG: ATP-dependent sacrificial sulfur transferase LarE [Eggerthellaceae bacterium]|nr:ATP-dependent sacrificial sulfur transferase LarE [Eggerthellaceae bacterium]
MEGLQHKFDLLKEALIGYGRVAVAFSAGVDSTLLLKVAYDVLGENVLAVTASMPVSPTAEQGEAAAFCRLEGVEHVVYPFDQLSDVPGFSENPENRCYLCKRALFARVVSLAQERGIAHVADGTNVDDMAVYRPGVKALEELGVESPLRDAGFTKDDIRALSRQLGLPTWDKPSAPCLATRFPYGARIEPEMLRRIEAAELHLTQKGFSDVRVRVFGGNVRVEVSQTQVPSLMQLDAEGELSAFMTGLGFDSVSVDPLGYRSGSMDEGAS